MITSEQWRKALPMFSGLKWTPETVEENISKIQLDAYNQGVRDSADSGYEEATLGLNPNSTSIGTTTAYRIANAFRKKILTLIKPT